IQTIGGYRPPDVTSFGTFTEHSSGEAVDVMVPNWSSPRGKAYGDQIAQWALSNADSLGTEWVIWQQKTFYPDGRVSNMGDRGNPTQNHYDHVHIKTGTKNAPAVSAMRRFGPGGGAPKTPSGAGGLAGATDTAGALSPLNVPEPNYGGMPAAIDTSGLYTTAAGSPEPVNAYGAGTPVTNEYGEPGYYSPDPKRVRDSQQRVDDAQESIRQADAAAAQARARLAELPYDSNESAKLSAQEGVRSAEARAAKARREAADAAADLAETRKGEFTAAKQGGKSGGGSASRGGGQGGGGGLGGVGSIFGSFLKDTFGIGDWLPALDNLWPLQAADTLMSAFMPLGVAAANGELGIQTPGWYPGMSEEEFTALKGGQTSTAPFGIPDIAAPPMPASGQHAGGGAPPGPAPVINVDQSQNFNNSPLGWDPGRVNKERDRNIQRAPRLPVGMGSS
ncbi:MAG TPA: hypothetical protein P5061_10735, partial [Mycobacterium sp.]|nr:hypothetical protein [Mycobacterium sp.]